MSSDEDLRALRHDIRGLSTSLNAFGTVTASLTARLEGLEKWVTGLDEKLDGARTQMAEVRGGGRLLVVLATTVAAGAGAIGALVEGFFHK